MVEEIEKVACNLQEVEPEKLNLIRRWCEELEGSNRKIAFELLNQVIEGRITSEEAIALLGRKHY